ncbi:trichohyalin, partial [Tachysurus ichikawai]
VRFDDSGPRVCTYPLEVTVVEEDGNSDDWRSTEEKQEEKDEECSLDEIIGAGRGLNRVLRVGLYSNPHYTNE